MKTDITWELNMISGGHCDPFVYRDADGIHIGDRDNHEIFVTVEQATAYANCARLSGAIACATASSICRCRGGRGRAIFCFRQPTLPRP